MLVVFLLALGLILSLFNSFFNFEKTRRKNFKCLGGWPFPPLVKSSFFYLRHISKLVNDNKILHMASLQGYLTSSCILYVEDIFVLCTGDIKSLRNLSIFLKTYGDFSGQYVNNSKSSFFTMDNSTRFVTKIQRILSCSHGCLPFNYL